MIILFLSMWSGLGLPANENFREKMRKFLFIFRKLFCEKNFAKKNSAKTISVVAALINCEKMVVEFSALIAQNYKFYYIIINNFSSAFFWRNRFQRNLRKKQKSLAFFLSERNEKSFLLRKMRNFCATIFPLSLQTIRSDQCPR